MRSEIKSLLNDIQDIGLQAGYDNYKEQQVDDDLFERQLKIIREDHEFETQLLDLTKEALKMLKTGIYTSQDKLSFLGLITILDFYKHNFMKEVNDHSQTMIIMLITGSLENEENASNKFHALIYTLLELKDDLEDRIKVVK